MIRRIMLYLNKDKPDIYTVAERCAALCRERGVEPVFFAEDEADLRRHLPAVIEDARLLDAPVPGEIDAIFVFGGDGTMLRALDAYAACGVPMLGVHVGRVGFLLETRPQELGEALDMLCRGQYMIERRMMLRAEGFCGGRSVSAYAVNEVSISRGLSQRMIAIDAYVGDVFVDHYIADGLLLSSPTGSTGYSLSAGGPIVSPDVQCFVLNPICPHILQSRPIVLSAREVVRLRIEMKEEREGIQLSVDGQAICGMHNHEEVLVSCSPHDANLIRFRKERNYFSLLKDKLSQWSL